MADYLEPLVMTAACAALAGFIAYRRDDKWHRFTVSLILLCAALNPLSALISELRDFDFSELGSYGGAAEGGAYEEVSEEAFILGIKKAVSEKTGLDEGSVYVSVENFDFEAMRAEKIKIVLVRGGVSVDYRALEGYIEAAGLGECEVIYGFE